MKRYVLSMFCCSFVATMLGCASQSTTTGSLPENHPQVVASRTAQPVQVDGKLDDLVWRRALRYELKMDRERLETRPGSSTADWGRVQFAWDDQYLYVAADFADQDLHAQGEADQEHHYRLGDLLEVFIRPADETWYWELYATPKEHKTLFWFPGPGTLGLPDAFDQDPSPLVVGAQLRGTLNQWEDRDEGWSAEMAIPIEMLTARGESFGPDADWYIFIGRYNYSRYLNHPGAQLTMMPQLPKASYHDWLNYAKLKLEK